MEHRRPDDWDIDMEDDEIEKDMEDDNKKEIEIVIYLNIARTLKDIILF